MHELELQSLLYNDDWEEVCIKILPAPLAITYFVEAYDELQVCTIEIKSSLIKNSA